MEEKQKITKMRQGEIINKKEENKKVFPGRRTYCYTLRARPKSVSMVPPTSELDCWLKRS